MRQQQPAQRDAALLAAGQVGHRRRRPAGRRSASMAISICAVEVVGALGGDLGLEPGLLLADLLVVGVGVGVPREDLVVGGEQAGHLGDAVEHVALDVLGLVEVRLLLEQAGLEAGGEAGLARVAVVDAGHDAQQRGLARAVGAEHADLGARVERQADVLEHVAVGRVEPTHLVHGEDELGTAHDESSGGTLGQLARLPAWDGPPGRTQRGVRFSGAVAGPRSAVHVAPVTGRGRAHVEGSSR